MSNPVLWEKLTRRGKRVLKRARFSFVGPRGRAQPIFIMGYGRSGTTMLLDAFEHDMRIEALGENDPRIARDYLLIRELVGPTIVASRAPVIVMKPILNSFEICELMREHPESRVIWVIRSFEPVVASALKKFGTSVAEELREAVVDGVGSGWLMRGLPRTTLDRLRELDVGEFGPNDWMALVWWSVNLMLLSPELIGNDRMLLVKYEDLMRDPGNLMRRIYRFIGLPYRPGATQWIDVDSAAKKIHVVVRAEVRKLCVDLLEDIETSYVSESSRPQI